jgi:hypothetical protein
MSVAAGHGVDAEGIVPQHFVERECVAVDEVVVSSEGGNGLE